LEFKPGQPVQIVIQEEPKPQPVVDHEEEKKPDDDFDARFAALAVS
jgi:hypothetical protein